MREPCKLVTDGARDGWVDYLAEMAAASDRYETANTSADEEALCYFTSGTTGYPKMTIHTHNYAIGSKYR